MTIIIEYNSYLTISAIPLLKRNNCNKITKGYYFMLAPMMGTRKYLFLQYSDMTFHLSLQLLLALLFSPLFLLFVHFNRSTLLIVVSQ